MLSYLTIGADDVDLSSRFYGSFLLSLGYELEMAEGYARFNLKGVRDKDNGPGTVYIMKPFDGGKATPGNGMMPAFRTNTAEDVDTLHAVGVAAGGVDEGAPGTRDYYSDTFYVGYLRDPVGNKVAIFTVL